MLKKVIFTGFLLVLFFLILPIIKNENVYASQGPCTFEYTDENRNPIDSPFSSATKIFYRIKVNDVNAQYRIKADCNLFDACRFDKRSQKTDPSGYLVGELPNLFDYQTAKNSYTLEVDYDTSVKGLYCTSDTLDFVPPPTSTPSQSAGCQLFLIPLSSQNTIDSSTSLTVSGKLENITGFSNINNVGIAWANINEQPSITVVGKTDSGLQVSSSFNLNIIDTNSPPTFKADISTWPEGKYNIVADLNIYDKSVLFSQFTPVSCSLGFKVPGGVLTPTPSPSLTPVPFFCSYPPCDNGSCTDRCSQCPGCAPPTPTIPFFCSYPPCDNGSCSGRCNQCPACPGSKPSPTPKIPIPTLVQLCDQLAPDFRGNCKTCIDKGEIWSAIGCLPTDYSKLIGKYVFGTGVGIAGGIAFLYFIYGCFLILTSAGNPEMLEEAKQIFTSSLAGLLLIIFSVFLLKIIGVDILKLPCFGPNPCT